MPPRRIAPALALTALAFSVASARAEEPAIVVPVPPRDTPAPTCPPPNPSQRHAVFRPAFNVTPRRQPPMETGYEMPTRPLFLSGYAGYNYGRGPRQAYVPTGFKTGTIATIDTTYAPRPVRRWRLFGR